MNKNIFLILVINLVMAVSGVVAGDSKGINCFGLFKKKVYAAVDTTEDQRYGCLPSQQEISQIIKMDEETLADKLHHWKLDYQAFIEGRNGNFADFKTMEALHSWSNIAILIEISSADILTNGSARSISNSAEKFIKKGTKQFEMSQGDTQTIRIGEDTVRNFSSEGS